MGSQLFVVFIASVDGVVVGVAAKAVTLIVAAVKTHTAKA
jgi:hypothetical protein